MTYMEHFTVFLYDFAHLSHKNSSSIKKQASSKTMRYGFRLLLNAEKRHHHTQNKGARRLQNQISQPHSSPLPSYLNFSETFSSIRLKKKKNAPKHKFYLNTLKNSARSISRQISHFYLYIRYSKLKIYLIL